MASVLLPRDLLELQVGQVDLLRAMYASDHDAVALDEPSSRLLESLRTWCEEGPAADGEGNTPPPPGATSAGDPSGAAGGHGSALALALVLTLPLPDRPECPLQLDISVPLVYAATAGAAPPDDPPRPAIRLRQPGWLSKAETARLAERIAQSQADDGDDGADLLLAIDRIMAEAEHVVAAADETKDNGAASKSEGSAAALSRTWFYFPSISTRAKRDDIVNYAPSYGLTGFLLAGKPGILCLEGAERAVYDYMSFIKTESWGDIPPQHKKVSERFRETGPDVTRAFASMTEITDQFGDRRGVRANRNDMKALETWMTDHGVGHAFEPVFI